MECDLQHWYGLVESAEFVGRAEQVSVCILQREMILGVGREGAQKLTVRSSSPLNGQAAELWDKDPAEYKRLVLARHQTPEELDA